MEKMRKIVARQEGYDTGELLLVYFLLHHRVQLVESLGREAERLGSVLGKTGVLCVALLSMGLICAGDNEQPGEER